MTEWSVERLDALPEGTVIEVAWESASPDRLINPEHGYWGSLDARDESECDWASDELAGNKWVLSIRVVSVPVDALLAAVGPASRAIIRGAIDTVTGESS